MAKTIEIEIKGADKLAQILRTIANVAPDALAGALYEEGESIRAESQERVPVDTGVLKNSAFVATEGQGDSFAVQVGYGGAAAEYAVVQHEDMTLRHDDGGPKFLENPALEHAKDMGERLAARIRARMRGQ